MKTPQQLTLGMSLGSDLDFENFVAGDNTDVVRAVEQAVTQAQFVYLWGGTGSGRTHLLNAACRAAADGGRRSALLPLANAADWKPEVVEGWESLDLVALDDMDAVAGSDVWERAVFTLYNGLRDAGAVLLVAASQPPAALDILLPDLKSRLGAMLVYQLHSPNDAQRLEILRRKARARGLDLPEDTGQFLLTRVSRDMHSLVALLNRLDEASLAHQRRLTIPFVREQLKLAAR